MFPSKAWHFIAASLGISSCLAHPLQARSDFNWDDIKYLITFGDSYTYVQGTDGYANSTFIGDRTHLSFNASELLSDYIIQNQTGTAEGGPNWVEYLTGCGLQPGLTLPRDCDFQLWDFAFGGSDISEAYTPLHHNWTVSLVNQVKQFTTYGFPVMSQFTDITESLVGVWIGINDIGDSAKYNVSFPSFYQELIGTLFESVETIYADGYKNFLFLNLPPLNRRPGLVNSTNPLPNATMIQWYDDALFSGADSFAAAHPDTNVLKYDSHAFLSYILDNAAEYGFVNITDYCPAYDQPDIATNYASYGCLPLYEYFWYNSGHMTSHVHELLAGDLRQFLEGWQKNATATR